MSQSRDFGPHADQMRVALERYSKPELIDLMVHIFRVYVLNSVTQPTLDIDLIHPPAELMRLSFPQLISHLQTTLDLEELDQFRVEGIGVMMRIGDGEFNVGGPTPVAALAAQVAAPLPPEPEPLPNDSTSGRQFDFAELAANPDAPTNQVSGEADFEFDDTINQRVTDRNPPSSGGPPRPEPVVPRRQSSGGRNGGGSGGGNNDMDDLFGGGSRRRRSAAPAAPSSDGLNMDPPPPPPPIAQHAPGDLSPEERTRVRGRNAGGGGSSEARVQRGSSSSGESSSRPGFGEDGPPPLSGDDKEITASNRFADLDIDFD